MERHLDFTIDFETCSLSANAAVMQVAIVPWLRDNDVSPFCNDDEITPYVGHVDLRSCVVDGFDFDPSTVKWWSENSDKAKAAVTSGFPEPISDVLIAALNYIRSAIKKYDLATVCLWCQGMDVDIAILRNLCRKYDVNLEEVIPHTQFRDCRTIILEAALKMATNSLNGDGTEARGIMLPEKVLAGDRDAYKLFKPLPEPYENGELHDALFDAVRSTWYTWQALKNL